MDQQEALGGGACTIFQRMNEQGDMLRVATNIATAEGKRAVGTYIPALDPDGQSNPVVAALLRGETYEGPAYVVDRWYITLYKPLRDPAGTVAGALFVGIPQESISSLREAMARTSLGQSGYLYVLRGSGANAGEVVIHPVDAMLGKSMFDAKDTNGAYCIREIIDKARQAGPDQMALHAYDWKNEGEHASRRKIVACVYFEPWD